MPTTNYNIRLDRELKDKAFSVFKSYGLTPSQAIKLFLNQVADTNTVPLSFDYQPAPSNSTLQALAELENGHYTESSLDEMLELKPHAQS
ncbi:type II toxin-antitoxin system RelB/DinJ family antitoxin [Psychrobacter sp. AH5]|uniref:type II toxin-antitoxin system RelB/DinJ family antitoxin n=1 Tax=Psychrobacter sp. AH5 TaxID=2937433 RepID=UPI0033406E48